MKCISCGVEIADTRASTHESEYCSDACENGLVTVCEVCGCLVETDDIVWRGEPADTPICTDCEPEGDELPMNDKATEVVRAKDRVRDAREQVKVAKESMECAALFSPSEHARAADALRIARADLADAREHAVSSSPPPMSDLVQFLNRLRILRSLDYNEVPYVTSWLDFRDDPYEYTISCQDDEAEHIWTALRKREPNA